jgi:hypothetical protein
VKEGQQPEQELLLLLVVVVVVVGISLPGSVVCQGPSHVLQSCEQ